MSTVKKDPVWEAMARKLVGYDSVPPEERVKMLKRCAKAGYDAIQNEHGRTPSEMVAIIRELRAELLNMVEKFEGAHIIECDDFSTSSAHSALTKTEDFR